MTTASGIEVTPKTNNNDSVDDVSGETEQPGSRRQLKRRRQSDPPRARHEGNGKASQPRTQKKLAAGARHRLWSICHDAQTMRDLCRRHSRTRPPVSNKHSNQSESLVAHALQNWKAIPNERCGSWYVPPSFVAGDKIAKGGTAPSSSDHFSSSQSCYFKSTDGHVNTWEFSLKRLNLDFLERTIATGDGGCLVVDSSVRKVLPDSFSRTIPIWATVLNRVVLRFREGGGGDVVSGAPNETVTTARNWDTDLHTPKGVVSAEEHATMSALIEDRVETLFRSGAIVNPAKLIELLHKPLRVVWMNHDGVIYPSNHNSNDEDGCSPTDVPSLLKDYFVVMCWNPSRYMLHAVDKQNSNESSLLLKVKKSRNEWINLSNNNNVNNDDESGNNKTAPGYFYTPGAADDHESWARHMTPAIFWKNQKILMDPSLDDDAVDQLIDKLVREAKEEEGNHERDSGMVNAVGDASPAVYSYSDRIGDTNLWIGSRRAGRPPECWEGFDAILNVTNQEYDEIMKARDGCNKDDELFYLQLPVEEGKRDRTQLERWMPVGLLFLIHHMQQKSRVLVHCAQGKDRSVAVALIFAILGCPLRFPLTLREEFVGAPWSLSDIFGNDSNKGNKESHPEVEKEETKSKMYLLSGIPEPIVTRLLDTGGKEIFLLWIHKQLSSTGNSSSCGTIQKLECLADKESIRIALHLIRQDRDVADPTRSTMQKINRFLMSSSIYR